MSELKNKCLIKSLGPFLYEKRSKTTRKQVFYTVFLHFLWSFGHPQMDPKMYSKIASGQDVWPNI
jgi:hypothetical protein